MCFSVLLNFCFFFAMGQLALEWSVSEPLSPEASEDQISNTSCWSDPETIKSPFVLLPIVWKRLSDDICTTTGQEK